MIRNDNWLFTADPSLAAAYPDRAIQPTLPRNRVRESVGLRSGRITPHSDKGRLVVVAQNLAGCKKYRSRNSSWRFVDPERTNGPQVPRIARFREGWGVLTRTIAVGIELPESAIADICRRQEVKEFSLFGSAAGGMTRELTSNETVDPFRRACRSPPDLCGVWRAEAERHTGSPRLDCETGFRQNGRRSAWTRHSGSQASASISSTPDHLSA
jgi:hypothetical protein